MSGRTFGSYIVFLLAANLLVKPLYILGIEVEVQNLLGPNSYGVYFGLLNFCFFFQLILDPGIHNFNTRFISQNRSGLSSHIGLVISSKLVLSILFLVILAIAGMFMNYPVHYYKWLFMIGLNFMLASIFVFIKSHFPALGFYSKETFFSVLDKLLLILLLGIQVYVLKSINIESFILSITFAYIIAIVIALQQLNELIDWKLNFTWQSFRSIIRVSLVFGLVNLFIAFYNRMDGVMLERLLDDDAYAAGVYAAGYRLLDASNMFALLFASLLLPMFANLLIKDEDLNPLINQSAQMMLVICVCIITAGYFYPHEIMQFLYDDHAPLYGQSFQILIISFFGIGMSYIFGTLITAGGKLFKFNLLLLVGVALNWYLNLQWIPTETALGAAKATVVTQIFVMLGQFLLMWKDFKFSPVIKDVLKAILFVGLAIMVHYFISKVQWYWMLSMISATIIILIASFLMGLIRLNIFAERFPKN